MEELNIEALHHNDTCITLRRNTIRRNSKDSSLGCQSTLLRSTRSDHRLMQTPSSGCIPSFHALRRAAYSVAYSMARQPSWQRRVIASAPLFVLCAAIALATSVHSRRAEQCKSGRRCHRHARAMPHQCGSYGGDHSLPRHHSCSARMLRQLAQGPARCRRTAAALVPSACMAAIRVAPAVPPPSLGSPHSAICECGVVAAAPPQVAPSPSSQVLTSAAVAGPGSQVLTLASAAAPDSQVLKQPGASIGASHRWNATTTLAASQAWLPRRTRRAPPWHMRVRVRGDRNLRLAHASGCRWSHLPYGRRRHGGPSSRSSLRAALTH